MSEADDLLVHRRSKRSTAGNRMVAALAEMTVEDMKDVEEDNDFHMEKDEEDVFESDFQSTEEEEVDVDADKGEKLAQDEDRRVKKGALNRVQRATALAHARQQATFHPDVGTTSSRTSKPKNRVSKDVSFAFLSDRSGKRHSKRMHTMLNTSATVNRLKHAQEKRASFAKKAKVQSRLPTQAELIAWALDNEEGNIKSHRDYLVFEEEKRKQAQVVRATIQGPLLRWISRAEEVQVVVEPPPHQYLPPFIFAPHPPPPPPQPIVRTEKVNKNYLAHELGQYGVVPQPSWQETMTAMFGEHVNWGDLKVYVTKGRPLSRPKQLCLLTGLPARYLDPRTNVPYANVRAYETLTRILSHEFVWSEKLGCYIAAEEPTRETNTAPTDPEAKGCS